MALGHILAEAACLLANKKWIDAGTTHARLAFFPVARVGLDLGDGTEAGGKRLGILNY